GASGGGLPESPSTHRTQPTTPCCPLIVERTAHTCRGRRGDVSRASALAHAGGDPAVLLAVGRDAGLPPPFVAGTPPAPCDARNRPGRPRRPVALRSHRPVA